MASNVPPSPTKKKKLTKSLSLDFKVTENLQHDHHFIIHDHWSDHRKWIARHLQTRAFKHGVPVLIMFSVVLCVVETEIEAHGMDVPIWLFALEATLQAFFIVEISMRIHAQRIQFFHSGWNSLDCLVVCADTVLTFLELAFEKKTPPARILRMLRVIRTLRMSRVLVEFRELYLIVHGMISALKTLWWGFFMIFVLVMVWGIFAVEVLHPINQEIAKEGIYDGCDRCERSFSTISQSVLTFFQTLVAGDSWGTVAIPIIERQPWTVIVFAGSLGSIQLGLMNLILAVIVDRATEARLEDTYFQHLSKEEQFESYKTTMQNICHDLDEDGSGMITKEELLEGVGVSEEFANMLKLMDISAEELGAVFNLLDSDRSGSISHREFVHELHKMRNGDSHTLLMLVKHDVMCVSDKLHALKDQIDTVRGSVEDHKSTLQKILESSPSQPPEVQSTVPKEALKNEIGTTWENKSVMSGIQADYPACGNSDRLNTSCQTQSPILAESPVLAAISESIVVRIQDELARLQKQLVIEHADAATLDRTAFVANNMNPQSKLFQSVPAQHERALGDGNAALRLAAVPPPERFQRRPLEPDGSCSGTFGICDRPGRGGQPNQIYHHN